MRCVNACWSCGRLCAVITAAWGRSHRLGWEETWVMLLCAWEEWEEWQKEEGSHESGWHLRKRTVAEEPHQWGSKGDEG